MEEFEVLPKTIEPNFVPIDNQSSGTNISSGGQNVSANTPTGGVTSSAPQQVFNIQKLSEITGDLGDIVAGTITMPASGYIRAGQNTYNNGAGFFLGYSPSSSAHQLSIGDGTTANSLTWNGSSLSVAGQTFSGQDDFGDGNDGALDFDGSSTVLGISPSSSTYTLTRDIYASNLTIRTGVTIIPNGFRIFVSGTLTREGTGIIKQNGGNATNGGNASGTRNGGSAGSAGSGGSGTNSGSLPGSNAGKGGVAGANTGTGGSSPAGVTTGLTGFTLTSCLGSSGRNGAQGGASGAANGGAVGGANASSGGTAGSFTAAIYKPRTFPLMVIGHQISGTSVSPFTCNGSDGGPSGGQEGASNNATPVYGGNGGGSGGNGGDGGFAFVAARILVLSNSNTFVQCKGGNGGAGGAGSQGSTSGATGGGGGGGGGGGHGGGGGIAWIVYNTLSSGSIVTDVSGGTGGTGGAGATAVGNGGAGSAGTNGSAGQSGITTVLLV